MIGFNIPIYIEGSLDCIKEAKFVEMESLLKNVVNGWKINLMLQKYY